MFDDMKQITFIHHYAIHLYELALQNFQPKCPDCKIIKERLEKFIGKKEVAWVKRMVKKRPYDINFRYEKFKSRK